MESGLTTGDIALLGRNNDMFGGNDSFLWIFALLILAGGGFGGFLGNNRNFGDYGQFATAASQQEILFGQQFQNLDNKLDRLGNGIADATFALNNSIHNAQDVTAGAVVNEGRNIQMQLANCCCEQQRNTDSVRYDMANFASAIQQNDTANTQKILDALAQNKIDALQAQVSELKTQNMFCGIPRINPYGFGVYPYANNTGCGCNCNGNI